MNFDKVIMQFEEGKGSLENNESICCEICNNENRLSH